MTGVLRRTEDLDTKREDTQRKTVKTQMGKTAIYMPRSESLKPPGAGRGNADRAFLGALRSSQLSPCSDLRLLDPRTMR